MFYFTSIVKSRVCVIMCNECWLRFVVLCSVCIWDLGSDLLCNKSEGLFTSLLCNIVWWLRFPSATESLKVDCQERATLVSMGTGGSKSN